MARISSSYSALVAFLLAMREFLLPGPIIKADEGKKSDQEENIEKDITYPNPFFEKNAQRHIDHHPGDAVKNGPGNFFEEVPCLWFYAAHD